MLFKEILLLCQKFKHLLILNSYSLAWWSLVLKYPLLISVYSVVGNTQKYLASSAK